MCLYSVSKIIHTDKLLMEHVTKSYNINNKDIILSDHAEIRYKYSKHFLIMISVYMYFIFVLAFSEIEVKLYL